MTAAPCPGRDCRLCPRLVEYRAANHNQEPGWFNGAVPSFGAIDARFLFVGLAPGRKGANRTGRPFTGDYAGELLYPSLKRFGLAAGEYRADPADGFVLVDARVTNAVRCAPPANKPLPSEFKACLPFLKAEIDAMPRLRGLFAIGRDAHQAVLTALGIRKSAFVFAHGAAHTLPGGLVLVDSFHCSRLNTNTGRLTETMFHQALTILLDRTASTS